MRKVTLAAHEQILIKVKFGKKVLFFNTFIIVLFLYLNQNLNPEKAVHLFLSIIFVVGIIAPQMIAMIRNLLRIFTHRVYFSNINFYYFKGFFYKRIKTVPLETITELYKRQSLLQKRMGIMSIKIRDQQNKIYLLKGIKNYQVVIDLLTEQIINNSERLKSQENKESSND